ncbi:MAG: AraC family transcriptional regulator [Alistipes sp.]|nr:AraC family transcriptional regulator [Alistipes sp.]
MTSLDSNSLKYLTVGPHEQGWGVMVTTVGMQAIEPNACYPAMQHPATYDFKSQGGRTLDEYQVVYITEGGGYFESQSVARRRVEAGSVMILFPGERHSYAPDQAQGWREFWVGFKGEVADKMVATASFTPKDAIMHIGVSNTLIALYRDAIRNAERENIGCQQLLSGIVAHMLGHILYKYKGTTSGTNRTEDIINEARQLMRERVHHSLQVQEVANAVGVGYSWFRQSFKRVMGIAPAQYINLLLIGRAKEMLVSEQRSITETAYALGFESVGQFSTLFRKIEGQTPRQFRDENRHSLPNLF